MGKASDTDFEAEQLNSLKLKNLAWSGLGMVRVIGVGSGRKL